MIPNHANKYFYTHPQPCGAQAKTGATIPQASAQRPVFRRVDGAAARKVLQRLHRNLSVHANALLTPGLGLTDP